MIRYATFTSLPQVASVPRSVGLLASTECRLFFMQSDRRLNIQFKWIEFCVARYGRLSRTRKFETAANLEV